MYKFMYVFTAVILILNPNILSMNRMNRIYPRQTKNELKKFPGVEILSLLNGHVYYKEIKRGPVKYTNCEEWGEVSKTNWNEYLIDWKVVKIYGKNNSRDYFSVLYKNEKLKQLVLVTRGMILKGFYKTVFDYTRINQSSFYQSGVYTGKETIEKTAIQTIKSVLELANTMKFSLVLTGHSFGAWLSETALFAIVKDISTRRILCPLKVVAFESPGTVGFSRIDQLKGESQIRIQFKNEAENGEQLLNIVEYLSEPNLFNCGSGHVASRTYEIPITNSALGPVLSATSDNKEATIISAYTHLEEHCEVRSLKSIVEFFLRSPKDQAELRIITDWPIIWWSGLVTIQVKGLKSSVALSKVKSLENLVPHSKIWFLYKLSQQNHLRNFDFNLKLLAVIENIRKNLICEYENSNTPILRCLEGKIEEFEDEIFDLITLYPELRQVLIET